MAAPSSVEQPLQSTGPRSSELPGTHSSISAPPADLSDAPLRPAHRGEPHGNNHGSIPTAGGHIIGEAAMEERKASIDARRASAIPPTTTTTDPSAAAPVTESTPEVTTGVETSSAPATSEGHDHEGEAEGEGREKKSHNPLHKLKEKLHHHKN